MESIDTIYLDMDGVLADFVGGLAAVLDTCPKFNGEDDLAANFGMPTNQIWRKIDAAGSDFWSGLEPYPWASDLVDAARAFGRFAILSSPSWCGSSVVGKMAWLDRHVRTKTSAMPFSDYVFTPDKTHCARPGVVLVDDRQSVVDGFRAAGGRAMLLRQPWNRGGLSATEIIEQIKQLKQLKQCKIGPQAVS